MGDTRLLPEIDRGCLPEGDRVSTRRRQEVYQWETEGVYGMEIGCLPKGDRCMPVEVESF